MVVLVYRGGEVVRTGLDLWVLALNWVQKKGVLVMLIGLVISMSYMWWAARASGLVASQAVSAPTSGTGGTGGRQPPPCVYAGGGSASDSDEMPPLEDVTDEEGDHFRIIATDVGRLMPLRMTFEDRILKREVRNWTGAVEVSKQEILRLDDKNGNARFNIASQSKTGVRFVVSIRPPKSAGDVLSTFTNWAADCSCQ